MASRGQWIANQTRRNLHLCFHGTLIKSPEQLVKNAKNIIYHPHLSAETHIVPAIAVIFTLLYWTVAVLCYSNYLD